VARAASEDKRKHEPQLSADQQAWPLTDIAETTDANGVIWGKGMHNGTLREWRLQIPPTNQKPVPLYAYFHGAGGWMTKYDEFSGILATSNKRVLLIGKGGMPEFDYDRNRDDFSWNAANDPKYPRDLDFARKLILHVQETYNVDKSRVYAAGFSGGSFMAQAMAAVHSDLSTIHLPRGFQLQANPHTPDALDRRRPRAVRTVRTGSRLGRRHAELPMVVGTQWLRPGRNPRGQAESKGLH
jgi:poly(3-hydroxybutyrate) depolymerase